MYTKTRSQLTPEDVHFIAETLSHDAGSRHAILAIADDTQTMTELLHDRRLFERTMTTPPAFLAISPHLFFYTFVYHALERRRFDDDVVDYVAAVCVEFRSSQALWHFAGSGKTLYFVDLINTLSEVDAAQQYYLRRYIGNAALFLTGFFPDFLFRRSNDRGAPPLAYFENIGRSQFGTAAGASAAYEEEVRPVLNTLAERFVEVRSAINVFTDTRLNLSSTRGAVESITRKIETLDDEGLRDAFGR